MKRIVQSVLMVFIMTVCCGLVYPLVVTGIAQTLFPKQANGSIITVHQQVVGSERIGQGFTKDTYFSSRPSAVAYDGAGSGATNLGATSKALRDRVEEAVANVRAKNHLDNDTPIPADLVTTSASGLDPELSPEAIALQIPRVAAARKMDVAKVEQLVKEHTETPLLGFIGETRVNVLALNLALDEESK